ncbi:MAG: site-2 protease family protein [Clostridia bacterium]|nr:site-2 protease family protein [Clostridia bacterium]
MNLLSFASVMESIGGVLLAVVVLLVMVMVHEFGHYVAGKSLGFKINEFSVGFGPAILKKRSKKTGELFALRVIPLGGYCAFDGEDEYEEAEPEKKEDGEPFEELAEEPSKMENDGGRYAANAVKEEKTETQYPEPKGERFNDQPPWKRIIVLIAGATMNYLFALLLIIIMFGSYGCIHSYVDYKGEGTPVVSETELSAKDVVLRVDGDGIYMTSDYVDVLSGKKQGETVAVDIRRKNAEGVWEEKTLQITLKADCNFESMIDLSPVYAAFGLDSTQYRFASVTQKEGFWKTVGSSFVYSGKIGGSVLRSLGELITGKISITSMGGPVTTIGVTAQAASGGMLSLLNIAAFIGVNLAVFNLLPIPALDGCKVIFCIIEWIRKKPVNRKVETMIHFIGIIFLFGFAILVDVLQLIL